ncbi:MAG: hypothetical protein Q8N18_18935 [Opitutaceae bacterium]|nr:hypothetical protein [Opitutaceae bacterium]
MTSRPFPPIPISEGCALETIIPYADAFVDGRVIASNPMVVFEVYRPKRGKPASEKCFLVAARRKSGGQLFRLLPPALRPEVSVLQRSTGTVGDVFREMVKDRISVSFLPLSSGAALFVRGGEQDQQFVRLRRLNQRSNRPLKL